MSETDRAPSIRLSVDQEVFIDTVRESDTIDDANVATEVTSFDRVGDAYVLEGAIVFAGYLTRSDVPTEQPGINADALSFEFDDGAYVQHVHHRMPFVLRVPVKSQPRGIVNVASRIAGWNLSVISAGWIRVVADLNIVGLNAHDGYHFQCGAQEDGDVFFGKEWVEETPTFNAQPTVEAHSTAPVEPPLTPSAREADTVKFDEFLLTRGNAQEPKPGSQEDFRSAAPDGTLQDKISALSEARGGNAESVDVMSSETFYGTDTSASSELANLDRFIQGSEGNSVPEPGPGEVPEPPSSQARIPEDGSVLRFSDARPDDSPDHSKFASPDSNQEASKSHVAEFEFEHQVSSADLEAAPEPPSRREEFVASRSFSDEGFHPTAGFVPNIHVSGQAETRGEPATQRNSWTDDPVEGQTDAGYLAEVSVVDASLWSFVDLTVPDRYYTLRYAIVMEDETLDLLSERLGCSKAEIVRVNRLSSETVIPGQTLKIPQSRLVGTP